jgi:hypothetical protein
MEGDSPKTPVFDPSHHATSGDIAVLARLMKVIQETPKTISPRILVIRLSQ